MLHRLVISLGSDAGVFNFLGIQGSLGKWLRVGAVFCLKVAPLAIVGGLYGVGWGDPYCDACI